MRWRRAGGTLGLLFFLSACTVEAETLRSTERHLELDTLAAHVVPGAVAYVVRSGHVLTLDPHALVITGREVRLALPDGSVIRCPLHTHDAVRQSGRVVDVTPNARTSVTWKTATWRVACSEGSGMLRTGSTTVQQSVRE